MCLSYRSYILGEVLDRYSLTSNQYISERTITKIDKVTSSLAEHGFYQFYQSIADFAKKKWSQKFYMSSRNSNNEDDLFQAIAVEQFKKPISIVLYLNGIATIIFIAEIFIFKWLKWRNCMQTSQFEF